MPAGGPSKPLRVQGVLFDLGETLMQFGDVDLPKVFEQGTRLAYQRLLKWGLKPPTFHKYHRHKLLAVRWNHFKCRLTGREFNSLDVLDRLNRRSGIRLTRAQSLELADLWYQPLRQCASVDPEAIRTLEALREDGLTLGLVSNTFIAAEVLDRHLQSHGLLDLLPVRVYSCEVGFRKPRPQIFRAALERSGLSARQTLFVGDNLRADVYGANRMGMISVLIDPLGRHRRPRHRPRHRIGRLAEIRQIVARYNGG